MNEDNGSSSSNRRPKLGSLILSILAAAIGVQGRKKLEEDFAQSSPLPFIVGGVIFTGLFILALVMVTKFVLSEP